MNYSGLTTAVRSEALQETSVTAGLRWLPPYGWWSEVCLLAGRPRREDGGARIAGCEMSGGAVGAKITREAPLFSVTRRRSWVYPFTSQVFVDQPES